MTSKISTLPKICILWSSINKDGHTYNVAKYLTSAMKETGLVNVDNIYLNEDFNLSELDDATMIVLGSPTYMGSVHSQMKIFFEKSGENWSKQKWSNKLAAGFTNSGFPSGDNVMTLHQMMTFACQHSMLWIPFGIKSHKVEIDNQKIAINELGGYAGLLTQSSKELSPGNIMTISMFGKRLAEIANRYSTVHDHYHA